MNEPAVTVLSTGPLGQTGLLRRNRAVAICGAVSVVVLVGILPLLTKGEWLELFGLPLPWTVAAIGEVALVELIWRSDLRSALRWNPAGVAVRTMTVSHRAAWHEVSYLEVRPGMVIIDMPKSRVVFQHDLPGWLMRLSNRARTFPERLEEVLLATHAAAQQLTPTQNPPLVPEGQRPKWLYTIAIAAACIAVITDLLHRTR